MKRFKIIAVILMSIMATLSLAVEQTNNKDGTVMLEWENGTVFEGSIHENGLMKHGSIYYESGSTYKGGFDKNGKFKGFGYYTWASGDKFKGWWRKGKRHGIGTYTWSNGDEQVADYKYGNKIRVISTRHKANEDFLIRECSKALREYNKANSGTAGNVFVYFLTGGSDSNQRSFDNNLDKAAHYKSYLDDNNCSDYIDY